MTLPRDPRSPVNSRDVVLLDERELVNHLVDPFDPWSGLESLEKTYECPHKDEGYVHCAL